MKLFKKILVILTAGVMLFSCGHSLNGETVIDEIEILSVSKNVTLKVGEISPKYYLKVSSNDEITVSDVVCLNVDETVAAVSLERTQIDNVVCYRIEGLSEGECVISFVSASGEISSELLAVTVLSAEDTLKEVEPDTMNEQSNVSDTETNTFSAQTSNEDTEADVISDTAKEEENHTDSVNQGEVKTVYVTPSGTRYHFSISCAGKNATATTLEEAIKTKTPCKKCAGG